MWPDITGERKASSKMQQIRCWLALTLNGCPRDMEWAVLQKGVVDEGAEGRVLNAVFFSQGHPVQHVVVVHGGCDLLQAHHGGGGGAHHLALEARLYAQHRGQGRGYAPLVRVTLVSKVQDYGRGVWGVRGRRVEKEGEGISLSAFPLPSGGHKKKTMTYWLPRVPFWRKSKWPWPRQTRARWRA